MDFKKGDIVRWMQLMDFKKGDIVRWMQTQADPYYYGKLFKIKKVKFNAIIVDPLFKIPNCAKNQTFSTWIFDKANLKCPDYLKIKNFPIKTKTIIK